MHGKSIRFTSSTVFTQAYRQPQTYYEEKIKSAPTYHHQKRKTLEDLVDPTLLNRYGGSLEVYRSYYINDMIITYLTNLDNTTSDFFLFPLNIF